MRQRLNALTHRVGASLVLRSAGQARLAWVVGITGPLLVAAALAPFRPSVGLAGFLFGTLLFVVAAALMVFGAVVEAWIGVPAERRSLEHIAAPLSSRES